MEIRRASAADVTAIAALEREIFPDAWSEKQILGTVCSEFSMSFVALSEGELIGYYLGSLIVPEGELFRIAVLPAKRRRGIGARLLSHALREGERGGLEIIFLEVRMQNTPARALYRSYGFVESGIRKNYYKDPHDDACLMYCTLTQ